MVQDISNWRSVGILPLPVIWSVVHGDIHVSSPHSPNLELIASKFDRRCEVLEGYSQVAQQSSVSPGQMLLIRTEEDGPVLLANVDGEIHAVSAMCPNDGQPLSDGTLRGDEVTCPGDGSVFNVRNGTTVPVDTSTSGLKVYRTHIDGNDILLGPRDA